MENLQEVLRAYIVAEIVTGGEDITLETPIVESGLIDSLGIFKIISFVEDNFGVQIEPEEIAIENFETINAICALVSSKK